MSIHCQSNKRTGDCSLPKLKEAGQEMFRYLAEVERCLKHGKPLNLKEHQEGITEALDKWTEARK